jgi:hypothetical protein
MRGNRNVEPFPLPRRICGMVASSLAQRYTDFVDTLNSAANSPGVM